MAALKARGYQMFMFRTLWLFEHAAGDGIDV